MHIGHGQWSEGNVKQNQGETQSKGKKEDEMLEEALPLASLLL